MVIRRSSTAFTVYQKFFLRIRRLNHYQPMQRYYTDLCLTEWDLSVKNRWFDDENKVYIIYTLKNIMEDFGCADNKATKLLNELDKETGIGLIERRRQGLGKTDIIYVKSFVITPENQHESGIVKITSN